MGTLALGACSGSQHSSGKSGILTWGSQGLRDGHFIHPRAVGVWRDEVYVIDKSGRVQVFDYNGNFKRLWNMPSYENGTPTAITFQGDRVILPDTHQSRILEYTPDGELLAQWGEYGTGDTQFIYPTGIVLLGEGRVAISEYGTDAERVRIFDADHKLLADWGKLGTEPGDLDRAMAIDVDAEGRLFVADTANHRVQCFDQTGKLLHIITGTGENTLRYPHDLKCATDGTVLVVEYGANRISRFAGDGAYIESFGSAGRDPGQFAAPRGVSVDADGVVFVADTDNHRVQRLQIKLNPLGNTLTQSKHVIPAKAGIQMNQGESYVALDSRFRGNDSVVNLIDALNPGRASA